MRMPPVVACLALVAVACSAAAPEAGSSEENATAANGFEYECASPGAFILSEAETTKVAVSEKRIRFTDAFGESEGVRDPSYRTPAGTDRMRFHGFNFGEDCGLFLVADRAMLGGAETAQLRVQCRGDDFMQDLYTCTNPRAVSLPDPVPQPPPPPPPAPAASAKRWTCTGGEFFGATITMAVDATAMSLENDDFEFTSARTGGEGGKAIYEDFGFGGDCSLSATIDETAIGATTGEVSVRVLCEGPDFFDETYACR